VIATDGKAPPLPHLHTAALGAGPANLSLAALFQACSSEPIALFDRQSGPAWHPQLLQPGVRMQTSWLKDLVSLIDPTHELTFLNYLVSTGRMFALLNAQFDFIPRGEYQKYLSWAAERLGTVNYGVNIDRITFDGDRFVLYGDSEALATSEHLAVGVGSRPTVPAGLSHLPAERAFVADELSSRIAEMSSDRDATVAVVGGGQTGLECVLGLLRHGFTDIQWLGRRQWFGTIDDSPVANEFYRPAHQQFLQALDRPTRRRLVEEIEPTGDATTPGALRALYHANYDGLLALGRFPVTLLPGRDVTGGAVRGDRVALHATSPAGQESFEARHVIIATGREHAPIPFDLGLWERMDLDDYGELILEEDYSVRWRGGNDHKIFALNRGRFSHGIPDANLTLMPVRSAVVLNSLFERDIYSVRDELCPVQWSPVPGETLSVDRELDLMAAGASGCSS
jgi:lysine N6-hydroxylase